MVRKAEPQVVQLEEARTVGLDPRGVLNEAGDEEEGEDADGDVDEEDPAPGEVVGDPAAEGGANGGRQDRDETVKGEGLAALLRFERVRHDGLGHGLHAAAARSLNDAEKQQHGQRGSRAAEKAGDGKYRDAKDEEIAPAEDGGRPCAHGQHDGVGHQVAGQHPGPLVGAGAQAAGDVRQGHVGDGRVQHLHEGGQGHRHRNQPGVDAGFPGHGDGRIRRLDGRGSDGGGDWQCGLRIRQKSSPVIFLLAGEVRRSSSVKAR